MIILGIESSCDETGVAIVENGHTLLAESLATSMDVHTLYGGVVPELAARSHIEFIIPQIEKVIDKFSREKNISTDEAWDKIDGIAVTNGAGLSGSLLVGVLTARTIAIIKNKPLYDINHVEGHVYANFLSDPKPEFPLLALIVSGGHTQLVYFEDHFKYKLLGQTVDDAIGEAFDKVAKIVGLPYPGGPSVARSALAGDSKSYQLPKPKVDGEYNFSYSGLKTAVLRVAQNAVGGDYRLSSTMLPGMLSERQKNDISASFQHTAVSIVVEKTVKAFKLYSPRSVVIAGGVAANQELRRQLQESLPIEIHYAPPALCTDNGAMIATLGCFKAMAKQTPADPLTLAINPNLKM
ncbi:tRNA (adenosine(37)-N6)-threonylcarbamoyltransferase complex transferase subunit TsaD [Candidatus Saccharibacteria bacterium]|nr:tRNA (adenosine(37)-N6)-threonylcarbamoyltransferase complex transferase subunit TsaD [Candidatus Saccharibacteria bacterium]